MTDETRKNLRSPVKKNKTRKPSQKELCLNLADIISGRLCVERDPFPEKYHAVAIDEGRHIVLRQVDGTGIVAVSNREAVANAVLKYVQFKPAYNVKDKNQALKVVDWWLALAEQLPMPPAFRMADDPGLTFARLPWRLSAGPTPTWDAMLGRCSNAEALKAWIGGLFAENAYCQQYVWVHGTGGDGKGCLNRFLARVFGPAYESMQPRERGDRFWAYSLLGKTLAVFPDCNDQYFITGGLFKSLTGGDPLKFEAKGQMSFTARLRCRFIIFSNEKPLLSSEKADLRRIIYCSFSGRDTADEMDFEERLWNEGGHFLHSCLLEAGNPKKDGNSKTEILDWIETIESNHDVILDKYFVVNKNSLLPSVSPRDFQRCIRDAYNLRKDQLDFVAWLERVHGIKKKTLNDLNDMNKKHYAGLFLRAEVYPKDR